MSRNSNCYILGIIALALAIMSSVLTDRTHAVTFTVNSTGDGPDSDLMDGICNDGSGACTLRAAIEQANSTVGLDTINFSIGGGGLQTIAPLSPLPVVFQPATIDGTTQPGFAGAPIIQLNGAGAGAAAPGLFIVGGASTIKGLIINRFTSNGIVLAQRPQNIVQSNYIGTDSTGMIDLGNGANGVLIICPNNAIGGTMPGERNIISGNDDDGVEITDPLNSTNFVEGNFIGTKVNGAEALSNGGNGVFINNSPENTIGGGMAASRNIISSNGAHGVRISGTDADTNVVRANFIGTDVTGAVDLGNLLDGVLIENGASGNQIGNTTIAPTFAPGNMISGNGGDGIEINGQTSTTNTVQGNVIGLQTDGDTILRNDGNGIFIDDAPTNTIGESNAPFAFAGNVISGQTNGADSDGIQIDGANADGNTVKGNFIGTNAAADVDRGNAGNGIFIRVGADNNLIGSVVAAGRNIISGNDSNGIRILGAESNLVFGNYIGTDSSGTIGLGNLADGVSIEGSSTNNEIGDQTATPGAPPGNIISGNGNDGIEFNGGLVGGADTNFVQGNLIGLQVNGDTPLGNGGNGVFINDAPTNTIGGVNANERNIISGHTLSPGANGIEISGENSDANLVYSNRIGTNSLGDADRGNAGNGVFIHNGADNNRIGFDPLGNVAVGNIISGNNSDGVEIADATTTGNQVLSNLIGTGVGINDVIANANNGVLVTSDASNNTIGDVILVGGFNVGGNVIRFNGDDGVRVQSGTGNLIRGNSIRSNGELGIDLGPNGVTVNDAGDGDTGANNLQNFPLIASAVQGSTIIQGTLNSTPSTVFTLDFYSSPTSDPTNHGEGENYLGTDSVTTNAGGNASFNTTFATTTPAGHVISATATDPASNTSEFSGVQTVFPPTVATLVSFTASLFDNGAMLEWQTGYEVDNLGFNVYREQSGRELVNQQMIAGSALVAGSRVSMQAGRSYVWWDKGMADCGLRIADCRNAQYWLEDVDINGKSTLHGPFTVKSVGGAPPAQSQAALLSQIGEAQPFITSQTTLSLLEKSHAAQLSTEQAEFQASLAAGPAVKLGVREEGWYRVSQPELISAGVNPKADPRYLQLFAGGVEQALVIVGENDGNLDAADAIEFYGKGLDTPASDTRVYWLVTGKQLGKRVNVIPSHGKPGGGQSFLSTVERKERSIYFASLLNGYAENFFGRVVASQPVDQTIPLEHLDAASPEANVEIALQGVTNLAGSPDHQVSVALNGSIIGRMIFDGREHKVERLSVYAALLNEGENTVTLTGQGGADVTLVDYIRISYHHTYSADDDELELTASTANGPSQIIEGFSTPLIRVIDVSDPAAAQQLAGQIEQLKGGSFTVTVGVAGTERALMAFTDSRIKRPASITANQPSSWRSATNGADMLMLTRGELAASLEPLRVLRQSQGLSVAVVDVEDIYDEFNFGEKNPQSLKEFIGYAVTSWKKKPRFVLLAGDASFDSRNYLGLGDNDLVPTRLIDTTFMETASDESLADFDNDGLAEVALGRLPMRTAAEASTMVAKIIGYARSSRSEDVLLVSDENSGYDFEGASGRLIPLVPSNLKVSRIDRGRVPPDTAKKNLIDAIYRGQKIVNYSGHGSLDLWNSGLLTGNEARGLANVGRLPVFVMMTCLNGYFQDPAMDSLGEALLKADGGAVAVWASSGLTPPFDQWTMNEELYRLVFRGGGLKGQPLTLGEAVRKAKAGIADSDIRRTWVLLGDPSMRLR